MCGIILVKSTRHIDLQHHLDALNLLRSRGPDLSNYSFHNNIFIGQSVLHITGSDHVYHDHCDFVFNGQIYNYKHLSGCANDTEFAKNTVSKQDWQNIKTWKGPWAWVWTDFKDIFYASDPQLEKHLFVYQDKDILIVTSEIKCIMHYVDIQVQKVEWHTKHWPMTQDHMPWQNVTVTNGGILYKNGVFHSKLDSLDDWRTEYTGDYNQAVDDLDKLLTNVCSDINPQEKFVISYSGGLDSSLLNTYFPAGRTVCLDITGKDPIVKTTHADQKITVDLLSWADAYEQVVSHTFLPLASWNWASYYILVKNISERIVISGAGADEIFGGYPYHLNGQKSPYSNTKVDKFLNDYKIQQGAVDLLGSDLVSGINGKETRNPFAHPDVIKFALSLPYSYKVNDRCKSILHDLYFKRTGKTIAQPKQGFAGHCNDAMHLIRPSYVPYSGDRFLQWKKFIQDDFYARYKH